MNMQYRTAAPADIDILAHLVAGLFALETDFRIDNTTQKAGLSLFFEHPEDKVIIVAADGGAPIGMATGQLVISTAVGGLSVLLEDMFIVESYRGMGIGRELVHEIHNWAAQHGARRIQLVADARNAAALEFYRHTGFKHSSMQGFYYSIHQ